MTTQTFTLAPAVTTSDDSITLTETFDADMATWLLTQKDLLSVKEKNILRNYYKKKHSGRLNTVSYVFGKNTKDEQLGRVYSVQGLGLQNFSRDVRAALAQKYYYDLDIVNAHATLLVQFCAKNGLKCPTVKRYCELRAECMREVMDLLRCEPWVAKQAITSMVFGGSSGNLPPFCDDIKKECRVIGLELLDRQPDLFKFLNGKENRAGKALAHLLQHEERKCILVTINALKDCGRSMEVLIHDGGLVRKVDGETELPVSIIRKVEEKVREITGYSVNLVVKPMETSFERPADYDDSLVPNTVVVDDAFAARKFAEWMGENLVMDRGVIWGFDERSGIWSAREKDLKASITNAGSMLVFKQRVGTTEKIYNYSGSVKNTANLWTKLPDVLRTMPANQEGYFQSRIDSDREKLLFRDGIYDFKTRTFTEGFDRNIVFRHACPRKFPRTRKTEHMDFIVKNSFVEPFRDPAEAKRLRHNLMRATIGDWRRKRMTTALGPKNSGKTALVTLLTTAFGDFVGTFDANSLLIRHGGEAARDLLWIADIHSKRFAFSSEIKLDDEKKQPAIDGNMLKKLVGGGDEVSFREMRETYNTKVFFLATVFILANDFPKVVPMSEEIKDRMELVDYHYSFQTEPTQAHHKPKNGAVVENYGQPDYGDAFFHLMCDDYAEWEAAGFAELPTCNNEIQDDMMEDVDVRNILLGHYELTNAETDEVDSKEIQDYLRSHSFVGSATKVTREMKQLGLTCKRVKKARQLVKVYCGIRVATE